MSRWLLLILLFIGAQAEARLRRNGFEGLRPLGMGNAFLAVADDQNILWYNPAALARVEGVHVQMLDLTLGVDSLDTLSRLAGAALDGNFDDSIRTDTQYVRLNAATSLVTPYFGISLFANSHTFLDLQNLTSEAVDIDSKTDLGVIAGVGLPIGEVLSIGFSLRVFQRFAIDEYLTPLDLLAKLGGIPAGDFLSAVFSALQDDVTTGYALGLNVGAFAIMPFTPRNMKWTLAATLDDFGNTNFQGVGGSTAPDPITASLNFGTAFNYELSRKSRLTISFDWRDFFGSDELFKRLHFGMEFRGAGFSLRGGLYQGRPTAGLSFEALPHTRLNFTTYAAELGDSLWAREHRWYLLQAVIGFTPF